MSTPPGLGLVVVDYMFVVLMVLSQRQRALSEWKGRSSQQQRVSVNASASPSNDNARQEALCAEHLVSREVASDDAPCTRG